MSDYGIPIEDIRVGGKPLSECELCYETSIGHYRFYVLPDEKAGTGFEAVAVEFAQSDFTDDKLGVWEEQNVRVIEIFQLTATFDGARHLRFKPEDDGYLYYPEMDSMAELMLKARELEIKHCWWKRDEIADRATGGAA